MHENTVKEKRILVLDTEYEAKRITERLNLPTPIVPNTIRDAILDYVYYCERNRVLVFSGNIGDTNSVMHTGYVTRSNILLYRANLQTCDTRYMYFEVENVLSNFGQLWEDQITCRVTYDTLSGELDICGLYTYIPRYSSCGALTEFKFIKAGCSANISMIARLTADGTVSKIDMTESFDNSEPPNIKIEDMTKYIPPEIDKLMRSFKPITDKDYCPAYDKQRAMQNPKRYPKFLRNKRR